MQINTNGSDTYSWDAFNRLSRHYDGMLMRDHETDAYDADGRRVRLDHFDWYDTQELELRVEYSYNGWQVLSEYEAAPTNMICVRQFAYGNYIDEPLVLDTVTDIAATNPNDSTYTYLPTPGVWVKWERFYYHQNTLFSVAALTDESGNLAEAYLYDPYGRTTRITDGADAGTTINFDSTDTRATMAPSTLGNPYMFTGRRLDDWSGLYCYRHRLYEVDRGRFISRDPMGYVDGMNLYSGYFAMRGGVDPMGLAEINDDQYASLLRALIDGGMTNIDELFVQLLIAYKRADQKRWYPGWCDCQDDMEELLDGFADIFGKGSLSAKDFGRLYKVKSLYTKNTRRNWDLVIHFFAGAELASHMGQNIGIFLGTGVEIGDEVKAMFFDLLGMRKAHQWGFDGEHDLAWTIRGARFAEMFDVWDEDNCLRLVDDFITGKKKITDYFLPYIPNYWDRLLDWIPFWKLKIPPLPKPIITDPPRENGSINA